MLILVTFCSGSTGKPKGVLHTTAGYMLYATATFRYVFDYRNDDIYWCSADVGWITGHTYTVYAPLANGATSVMVRMSPTTFFCAVFVRPPTQLESRETKRSKWHKSTQGLCPAMDVCRLERMIGQIGIFVARIFR